MANPQGGSARFPGRNGLAIRLVMSAAPVRDRLTKPAKMAAGASQTTQSDRSM